MAGWEPAVAYGHKAVAQTREQLVHYHSWDAVVLQSEMTIPAFNRICKHVQRDALNPDIQYASVMHHLDSLDCVKVWEVDNRVHRGSRGNGGIRRLLALIVAHPHNDAQRRFFPEPS